jgi:hypothetical protein
VVRHARSPPVNAGNPVPDTQRIQIDSSFLADVGLALLPATETDVLLHHVRQTLEIRVGMALVQRMTIGQVDEFEALFNAKDDDASFRWLESNFPDYKDVVLEEYELLSVELRQIAPTILMLSGARA